LGWKPFLESVIELSPACLELARERLRLLTRSKKIVKMVQLNLELILDYLEDICPVFLECLGLLPGSFLEPVDQPELVIGECLILQLPGRDLIPEPLHFGSQCWQLS